MASAKRQAIIETATRLFNQYGYNNIGVDRIIEESNVAKMTFYNHFASKDNLILECLKARDEKIRQQITDMTATNVDTTLAELKSFFDWYRNRFEQNDFYGCMFVRAVDDIVGNLEIHQATFNHKEWLTNKIHEILINANIANAYTKAQQIRLVLDGASVNETIYKDKQAIELAWDITAKILSDDI